MLPEHIEINEEFKKALDLMEHSDKHVFVTGKAGTGKSTLLEYFRQITSKRVVVLAPTGVAALNVNGETIHSFFKFGPDITIDKVGKVRGVDARVYKNLDAIVIDEISMVRADLMDCIDAFMRINGPHPSQPFGGVQLIMIGDLYQLPPVVTSREKRLFRDFYKSEYFFDAKVFENVDFELVELKKVYRQSDPLFIEILNQIRNNTVTDDTLDIINSRVGVELPETEGYRVYLTTTNKMAQQINQENLSRLRGRTYRFTAEIEGEFDERSYPTDFELVLKKGAQVMMLNNDQYGRWVNGSIGIVRRIRRDKDIGVKVVEVEFPDGRIEDVLPHTWDLFHYYYNEDEGKIETETIGTFTQYPMKLAWAITIHKSQGKTFDQVVIDIGRGTFAHGQLYVALSRCRTLEGISLVRPIARKHIFMDWRIVRFLADLKYRKFGDQLSVEDKIRIINEAIDEDRWLWMRYLKPTNEESIRVVKPLSVRTETYRKRRFTGMRAYCSLRKAERMFRVDRILELQIISEDEVPDF